jgi:hypothetical protein
LSSAWKTEQSRVLDDGDDLMIFAAGQVRRKRHQQKGASVNTYNGMPVTVTETVTAALPEEKWDWSAYRSPSRARRRRDRRKVVTREPACFQLGNRIVMHPALWARLKAQLDANSNGLFRGDAR